MNMNQEFEKWMLLEYGTAYMTISREHELAKAAYLAGMEAQRKADAAISKSFCTGGMDKCYGCDIAAAISRNETLERGE
jgi:hypothetical protein